jgi:hypothetical protein
MNRNSLVARAAVLSGLVVLAGCSKEIDFTLPAEFTVNSTGGVAYNYVQQIDLSVDAADAWSHKDKVKDLSLVDVTGSVVTLYAPAGGTTGSGTVWLRPDTATDSSTDVSIGTYSNQTIATGQAVIVTLVPAAMTIVNDALAGNGRFKVVATGTTAASANFLAEFILHMKMNYKII